MFGYLYLFKQLFRFLQLCRALFRVSVFSLSLPLNTIIPAALGSGDVVALENPSPSPGGRMPGAMC